MKIIFSGLFLITSFSYINAQANPTPEKVANQLCTCGQPLVDMSEKYASLTSEDPKAYANYREKAAKEVLACLGGFEYIEAIGKHLSYEQKVEFELAVYSKMKNQCADVAKHFPLK